MRLELLKLVSDLAEKESDRGMARYNLFFLIQAALTSVLTFKLLEALPVAILSVSIVGAALCYTWYEMLRWNYYWQDRWIENQKLIVADTPLAQLFTGRDKEKNAALQPKTFLSGRTLFKVPPIVFGAVWSLMACYGIYLLIIK